MLVDKLIAAVLLVLALAVLAVMCTLVAVTLLWLFLAFLESMVSLIAAVFDLFSESEKTEAAQDFATSSKRKHKNKQPAKPFVRDMPDGMRAVQALLIEQKQAQTKKR